MPFFKEDQKLDFSTESLKLARRMSANISAFFLIILVGISVSSHALEDYNFKIPFRISALFIFEKENASLGCLLHTSPTASILGWYLYFTIDFKTRSLILLARALQFQYSLMLRLLAMLEKKVFKTLAVLWSPIIISFLSTKDILFVDLTLSNKKGLKSGSHLPEKLVLFA